MLYQCSLQLLEAHHYRGWGVLFQCPDFCVMRCIITPVIEFRFGEPEFGG